MSYQSTKLTSITYVCKIYEHSLVFRRLSIPEEQGTIGQRGNNQTNEGQFFGDSMWKIYVSIQMISASVVDPKAKQKQQTVPSMVSL